MSNNENPLFFWLLIFTFSITGLAFPSYLRAEAEPPAPSVSVQQVQLTEVTPSETFSGRVEATATVALVARVQGFLEQQLFNEGDFVESGQLLYVLEKGQYEADVKAVEGTIHRLRGTLKLAEIERDRRQQLVARNQIARTEFDRAVASVDETQGDLISQNALLDQAKLNLSYTDITAPISGYIGFSNVDIGDVVGPSTGSLATIVSRDPIYVNFPVSQRQLLMFRQQQEQEGESPSDVVVKVRMADNELYAQEGKIDFVDVLSNPGTDTTTVRAEFPNPDGFLVHQQLVTVVLEEQAANMQLTVPQRAIQIDQIGSFVLLVDDENTVQVQRIEAGDVISGKVVVQEGLNEGDRVIVLGIQKVRPGMVVNPTLVSSEEGGQ